MIDVNKEILFIYRWDSKDDKLEHGLIGMGEHTKGRELASIMDVTKDDEKFNGDDAWGLSHDNPRIPRIIIVKEGMFEYHKGSYLSIF